MVTVEGKGAVARWLASEVYVEGKVDAARWLGPSSRSRPAVQRGEEGAGGGRGG